MTRRWLPRLLAALTATAAALVGLEAGLRRFAPVVTPAQDEQRYTIDGRSASATGYFTADPLLPVSLLAGYDHEVADLGWSPTPFRVTLDRHGYRNPGFGDRSPAIAVIGDSVTFGFGVAGQDTMTAALAASTQQTVENLGVPNLGLESYPVVLRRYLQRPNHAASIVTFVYAGNDFANLASSYWEGRTSCHLPSSRIYRADIAASAPGYPTWLLSGPLQSSQLLTRTLTFATTSSPSEPWTRAQAHRLSALAAISALAIWAPTAEERAGAIVQAKAAAAAAADQACTTAAERTSLQAIEAALDAGDVGRAADMTESITVPMLRRGCALTAPTLLGNPLPPLNYFASYYWRSLASPPVGPIERYAGLLDRFTEADGTGLDRQALAHLSRRLRSKDRSVEPDIRAMIGRVDAAFPSPFEPAPPGCDLVARQLQDMRDQAAAAGVAFHVVYSVSEAQLRVWQAGGFVEGEAFCRARSGAGISCLNLAPIAAAQTIPGGPALYVDGAHFSAAGNAMAGRAIAEWLGRRQGIH